MTQQYLGLHPSWAATQGHHVAFSWGRPPSWRPRHLQHRAAPDPAEREEAQEEYDEEDDEDLDDEELLESEGGEQLEPSNEDERKALLLPDQQPHSCTDWFWLSLFILGIVAAWLIVHRYVDFSHWRENLDKYNPPLRDWEDEPCNPIDNETKEILTKRKIFFCALDSAVSLNYPICVHECPTDSLTVSRCWDDDLERYQTIPNYKTYPSLPTGKKTAFNSATYCMPDDKDMKETVLIHFGTKTMSGRLEYFSTAAVRGWYVLLFSGLVSIIVGYTFLFFLDHASCAKLLVQACVACIIIAPLYFAICYLMQGIHLSPNAQSEHEREWNVLMAGVLILVSCITMCVSCVLCQSLDVAIASVEAAAECFFDEPSLLFEPMIGLFFKSVLCVTWASGLLMLGSKTIKSYPGGKTEFEFSSREQIGITVLYILIHWWWFEFCHSLSQFVLAYATQRWYYHKKKNHENKTEEALSPTGICKAYGIAIGFHMGSIALGSLLVALLRGPRFLLRRLRDATLRHSKRDPPCAQCIKFCCCCCLKIFNDCIRFVDKDAYMDLAITSSNFWPSAKRARTILRDQKTVINDLKAARVLFMMSAMGIIIWLTQASTYYLCTKVPQFSNPEEDYYISDHFPLSIMSIAISVMIGLNFLVVLDTVGDTLFYILATEQRRWRENNKNSIEGRVELLVDKAEEAGFFQSLSCIYRGVDNYTEEKMNKEIYAPPKLRKILELITENDQKRIENEEAGH